MIVVVAAITLAAGCIFLVLGMLQIGVTIYGDLSKSRDRSVIKGAAADDLTAAAKLIEAFAKLPTFVLLASVGVVLIGVGQRLLDGKELFSY